jgi:cytochrome c biogenesis protein CcmG, thiol:disulfide interchange protein DsbE
VRTARPWAAVAGRLLVGGLLAGPFLVACAAGPSAGGQDVPALSGNPSRAHLVAVADLDPCPTTSASPPRSALPRLTLPCLGAGPAVDLAGLAGRVTVLNIWGSWCVPCQEETPHLAQVYNEVKSRVRFLGVDTEDDPDSALDFAAHVSPPMRYPSVVDQGKKVLIALHLSSAVPATVFVDAAGRIVHVTLLPYRSAAALRGDLARYLGVAA